MRLVHDPAKTHATFDDPNLVSRAGLVPVMALAQRAGLPDLVAEHVRIARSCGVNAPVKVSCLAAGMIAGADSIDDMDLLRHGAMPALFGGVRAPSTLGSFLRAFTWGNVLHVEKVSPAAADGAGLPGPAAARQGHGCVPGHRLDAKARLRAHEAGRGVGHTKIQGKSLLVRSLNGLAATISTPLAAPVIAATRLRGGNAASARGAASFATASVTTGPQCRVQRDAGGPGRLGVLLRGAHRHRAPGRGVPLHHRPADRPPGQRPQHPGRPGPRRAVPRLALPRHLHRGGGRPGRGLEQVQLFGLAAPSFGQVPCWTGWKRSPPGTATRPRPLR